MTEAEAIDVDPDQLRARYEEERLKRVRDDGPDQYIEMGRALRALRR